MANKRTFTPSKQDEFLAHLRAGMRRGAAAETMKISRQTVLNFIDDHPDFEKRVLDAELEATEHVEEALYQAAISGNVAACRVWLELRGGGAVRTPTARRPSVDDPVGGDNGDFSDLDNVTALDPRQRRKPPR